MRTPFFAALFLSVVLGVTYWYQSTAYLCPAPLAYRLFEIDPEFDLTHDAAREQIESAIAVWESAAGRTLFVYDPAARFTINFIFDERQQLADSEAMTRADLDQLQIKNDELLATIEVLTESFASSQRGYEAQVQAYENRLAAHNAAVVRYNDRGGAPPDIFEMLAQEQQTLDVERRRLQVLSNELNTTAQELNRLSDVANRQITAYNRQVAEYNSRFANGREFTQGDYQGDRINIYKFSDEIELVSVLAHEFGHALGIDHVEGEDSVMYYLLTERTTTPTLSAADRAAFWHVCGTGDEWDHRVRQIIRSVVAQVPGI